MKLLANGEGFMLQQEPLIVVYWRDVTEVLAFKRDLFAYDTICVGFVLNEKDSCVEIHEEMQGFVAVREAMESQFGISASWYGDIMLPAFETHTTTLWKAA